MTVQGVPVLLSAAATGAVNGVTPLVNGPFEFTFRKELPPPAAAGPWSVSGTSLGLLFWQCLYIATGICHLLTLQLLHYEGAAESSSLLPVTATYFGMVLSLAVPRVRSILPNTPAVTAATAAAADKTRRTHSIMTEHQSLLLISLLDLFGLCCSTAAINIIFQVVYSSIIVVTAILSRVFLNRALTRLQWLSVVTVTLGLCVSVVRFDVDAPADARKYMLGIALAVTGMLSYAGIYLLTEQFLKFSKLTPQMMCFFVGSYCCFFCGIYLTVYTLPNWNTLITQNLEAHGAKVPVILCGYGALIVLSLFHNYSYYVVLGRTGSVSTGILQAVRTVGVFMLSSMLFCRTDQSQCITAMKSLSVCIVCAGLMGYVFGARRADQSPPSTAVLFTAKQEKP